VAHELKKAASEATNAQMNPIVTIPFTPAGRTSFTITAKAASSPY
jgi:hypothetical protein